MLHPAHHAQGSPPRMTGSRGQRCRAQPPAAQPDQAPLHPGFSLFPGRVRSSTRPSRCPEAEGIRWGGASFISPGGSERSHVMPIIQMASPWRALSPLNFKRLDQPISLTPGKFTKHSSLIREFMIFKGRDVLAIRLPLTLISRPKRSSVAVFGTAPAVQSRVENAAVFTAV